MWRSGACLCGWFRPFRVQGHHSYAHCMTVTPGKGDSYLATSWAPLRGISVDDICAAARCASPHTFIWFQILDMTLSFLACFVLSDGSSLLCASKLRRLVLSSFLGWGVMSFRSNLGEGHISDSELPSKPLEKKVPSKTLQNFPYIWGLHLKFVFRRT